MCSSSSNSWVTSSYLAMAHWLAFGGCGGCSPVGLFSCRAVRLLDGCWARSSGGGILELLQRGIPFRLSMSHLINYSKHRRRRKSSIWRSNWKLCSNRKETKTKINANFTLLTKPSSDTCVLRRGARPRILDHSRFKRNQRESLKSESEVNPKWKIPIVDRLVVDSRFASLKLVSNRLS